VTLDRILAEGGAVEVTVEGVWRPHQRPPTEVPLALLPGAFNPSHEGHRQLAEAAAETLAGPVALELSLANVDKPNLSLAEVRRRVEQLAFRIPIWITRAATFVQKAELFPGTVFVVGADTAARIIAPRYYGSDSSGVTQALEFLRRQQCRFLVGGRCDASQRFVRLEELAIPMEFGDLFREISPDVFRLDISSTELRRKA
jgi:Cytidylyltransferase-like